MTIGFIWNILCLNTIYIKTPILLTFLTPILLCLFSIVHCFRKKEIKEITPSKIKWFNKLEHLKWDNDSLTLQTARSSSISSIEMTNDEIKSDTKGK